MTKLSAPMSTTVMGDGIERDYYGDYGDLQKLSGKPEQPREQDATGQYTPLHIGWSSNGKGGNMGMGAIAPSVITIHRLISDIATVINFRIGRSIIIITAPVPTLMLTMKLTMVTLSLVMVLLPLLVVIKPCFGGFGGTQGRGADPNQLRPKGYIGKYTPLHTVASSNRKGGARGLGALMSVISITMITMRGNIIIIRLPINVNPLNYRFNMIARPNGSGGKKTIKVRKRIIITSTTTRRAAALIGVYMSLMSLRTISIREVTRGITVNICSPSGEDGMSKVTGSMTEAVTALHSGDGRLTRRRNYGGAAGSHLGARRNPCHGMSSYGC